MSGDTKVMIPDIPNASGSVNMKARKRKLFKKRAGIEPVIGHCKSNHRLGRNFYKGLFRDSVNVKLAAAAFTLKRATRLLLCLIRKWLMELQDKVEERIILTKSHVDLSVPAFF